MWAVQRLPSEKRYHIVLKNKHGKSVETTDADMRTEDDVLKVINNRTAFAKHLPGDDQMDTRVCPFVHSTHCP
jgi:hypothetical protein